MLEELLNHIITKDIGHQLNGIGVKFTEDLVFFIAVGSLELLLDESGAMLITTEFDYVVVYILDSC